MKESNKLKVGDIFGSLINNEKAIICSKKAPFWVSLILFFAAVIIAVIPLTVAAANSYGSAFFANNAYGLEKTMPILALEMSKDNVSFLTVTEDHLLSITTNEDVPAYKHTNAKTGHIEMEIFFSAAKDSKSRSAFINLLSNKKEILKEDGENTTYYHPSYTVFFNDSIYCAVYELDSVNILTQSTYGDYKTFKPGTNLVEVLTTVEGQKIVPTSAEQINEIVADSKTNSALLNNWRTVFNKAYETSRSKNTWVGSLIYLGIYTGMSLIMGLLLFIMSRGKNNPFNYLSILACYKIEAWASIAPSLIALILGFFLSQYAVMLFIMTLGMRVMWMSMRQLRPQA